MDAPSHNTIEDTRQTENSLVPLTFGVELEFLFGYNPEVVENDPDFQFLRTGNRQGDAEDAESAFPDALDVAEVAATILRTAGKRLIMGYAKDSRNYKAWSLCEERNAGLNWESGSISRVAQLEEWTGSVWTSRNDHMWRSRGLELVSPPLICPEFQSYLPQGLDEVKQIVASTKPRCQASTYHFISNHVTAGLHVHIGCNPGSTGYNDGLPLNVLQHLAFITILFEDVITLLHHPERRGFPDTKSVDIANSNRQRISHPQSKHICFQLDEMFVQVAGKEIFEQDMNKEGLKELMSGNDYVSSRLRIINWDNIPTDNKGRHTVEFRQHHGTLEYNEIEQWVVFVTALVRAAERFAALPTPITVPILPGSFPDPAQFQWKLDQVNKYPFLLGSQKERLGQLFEIMDLPQGRREYWAERAEQWKEEKYTNFDTYGICTECDKDKETAEFEAFKLQPAGFESTEASTSFDWSISDDSVSYIGNWDSSDKYTNRQAAIPPQAAMSNLTFDTPSDGPVPIIGNWNDSANDQYSSWTDENWRDEAVSEN